MKIATTGKGPVCSSFLPPHAHLCPSGDTAHSWVPRPSQRCSSTSPGSDKWAAHVRSPSTQTRSESTDPAQLEPPNLRERTTMGGRGGGGPVSTGGSQDGMNLSQVLTHTAIPLQHPPGLAGAFETPQCVQTVSILADSLHGALVDVCHVRGMLEVVLDGNNSNLSSNLSL